MRRANFATMPVPDPAWGERLAGPDAKHLAFFDAQLKKSLRPQQWLGRAGPLMFGAAFAMAVLPLGVPGEASLLVSTLGVLGILFMFDVAWVTRRMSFAVHRMWGVYERGFVAPWYRKGGRRMLIPWPEVRLLRFRRMEAQDPRTKAASELFLIRAVDTEGLHHRFWESELTESWGFTREEAAAFREAFVAAASKYLTPERWVIEPELSHDRTP